MRREVKHVRQLQIDMPVRWSSTYVMTTRAEEMRDVRPKHFDSIALADIQLRSLMFLSMRAAELKRTLQGVKKSMICHLVLWSGSK